MKIVHVEEFFHPDAGYQVNLLSRLQVTQGHDVTVVTAELDKMPTYLTSFFGKDGIPAKDRAFERETGVNVIRVPLLGYYSGRAIFYPRLFRVVSDCTPDVVFVHGEDTLTGILYIWLSRWLPFPIVLDCHMLEMASLNRFREYFRSFYRRFVAPVIVRRRIPLIRVVNSDYVQKCLGIPLAHTDLLSFGTDTDHFRPDAGEGQRARVRLGLSEDAFVILYAGKLDETKGGVFLADSLLEPLASASGKPIEVLVVGTTDGDYGLRVESLLSRSGNKIVRMPTQRYFDLARIYQAVDLVVFARQCSLSFFEAQSCGVPVLFEENEINNQRATNGNAFLFTPGSVDDFRKKMILMADMPEAQMAEVRANARGYVLANYDYVPIAQKFTDVMQRALDAWRAARSGS